MDDRLPTLSLVIPAYNEAAGIGVAIAEADAALAALTSAYEILVVDDGSSDDTAQRVAEAARDRPYVRLLQHPCNRGYGAALRTGFEQARHELVAFTDADCQFHLEDLAQLLPQVKDHALAIGRRIDRQDPWRRRFLSWGYNVLARTLLGTRARDCDCALKVFRRAELVHLLPESRGFFVNTEMLTRARQLGYTLAEVGVRHRPRLHGTSKVSLGDVPRTLRTLAPFWWSAVLFRGSAGLDPGEPSRVSGRPANSARPGCEHFSEAEPRGSSVPGGAWDGEQWLTGHHRGTNVPRAPVLWETLLVLFVAALLFFGKLGVPLQEPQESRYAEIPRQMLAEGSITVPVYYGMAYLDKPPLLYWLVMGSYAVCGVHDWAARLVPSTAGFLCVAIAFWWARRTVGSRAALLGALILCLSARFVQLGRLLTTDSLLCLWIVAAWAAAHVAMQRPRLHWGCWSAAAVACGLGLLTKGPVALVLVVTPIIAFRLLDHRAARLCWAAWGAFAAIALGMATPWYVAMFDASGDFGAYFFVRHNVERFFEPFNHEEPAWFYLPDLVAGMLPWTLLLPGLVVYLCRRSGSRAAKRPMGLGFFLLAFGWALAFFSLAGCKRSTYILPAMPPLALALGCYLDAILPGARAWQRNLRWLAHPSVLAQRATLLTLLAAAGMVLAAGWRGFVSTTEGLAFLCVIGALLGGLLAWRRRPGVSWGVCKVVALVVMVVAVQLILPAYARQYSLRGVVRRHAAEWQSDRPVVSYPRRWDSVSFYLGRHDVHVYSAGQRQQMFDDLERWPETLVFVKSERWLPDFLRGLPPELEFVPQGRQGYVSVGIVRRRGAQWAEIP